MKVFLHYPESSLFISWGIIRTVKEIYKNLYREMYVFLTQITKCGVDLTVVCDRDPMNGILNYINM